MRSRLSSRKWRTRVRCLSSFTTSVVVLLNILWGFLADQVFVGGAQFPAVAGGLDLDSDIINALSYVVFSLYAGKKARLI
jgi:hypothetical protein